MTLGMERRRPKKTHGGASRLLSVAPPFACWAGGTGFGFGGHVPHLTLARTLSLLKFLPLETENWLLKSVTAKIQAGLIGY